MSVTTGHGVYRASKHPLVLSIKLAAMQRRATVLPSRHTQRLHVASWYIGACVYTIGLHEAFGRICNDVVLVKRCAAHNIRLVEPWINSGKSYHVQVSHGQNSLCKAQWPFSKDAIQPLYSNNTTDFDHGLCYLSVGAQDFRVSLTHGSKA